MKYKKSLFSIIIMSLFITGCSVNKSKTEEKIADSVTKQKTMTKVQNNVNEIIDKNYDYVIKNMGQPYRTFYYIDFADIRELKKVDELTNVEKIIKQDLNKVLVYPKNTHDSQIEKSALYISLKKDKVIDVETREFNEESNKEFLDDSYMVVDNYKKENKLDLSNIEKLDLNKYVGENIERAKDLVGKNNFDFEIYDGNTNLKVRGYLLKDGKNSDKKALIIAEENKLIKNIMIIDKNMSIGEIFKAMDIK